MSSIWSMPSSMEELREPISLPSSFQMELLSIAKNKNISSGNKGSQPLNFPVACSFNGLPRWEHRYHTAIHLIRLIWGAEVKLEIKFSIALFFTDCSCWTNNFNLWDSVPYPMQIEVITYFKSCHEDKKHIETLGQLRTHSNDHPKEHNLRSWVTWLPHH